LSVTCGLWVPVREGTTKIPPPEGLASSSALKGSEGKIWEKKGWHQPYSLRPPPWETRKEVKPNAQKYHTRPSAISGQKMWSASKGGKKEEKK